MRMKRPHRRREAGSAMVALVVAIVICGGLSAAVMVSNNARQREAVTEMARERAFLLAEAGADWAVARIRVASGAIPNPPFETRTIAKVGTYEIRYTRGDANGRDDNGDGTVDDAAEDAFDEVVSTGIAGGIRRSVQVLLRKAVEIPTFTSSVLLNVEVPVLDLKGNAFLISGEDHLLDGTIDPSQPEKAGISSPAEIAALVAQIQASNYDQIVGLGSDPSILKVPPIDLDKLMEQAWGSADFMVQPGTHANLSLGTPAVGSTVVAYCNGDLHLSGTSLGAGVLCVDGDLRISGSFTWVGIILVRGRVTMVGGGGDKRSIGTVAVGEEVLNPEDTTSVTVTGTVDMLYSSDAIDLSAQRLAMMVVVSWREVANP